MLENVLIILIAAFGIACMFRIAKFFMKIMINTVNNANNKTKR
ncbi:hypothetical protein [Clostridium butyricum]|nr:hypothetical protein [Clostridium butyricum]KIU07771.1 hypothetical protein SC08_Contig83orf01693 [Clostridium butyricum]MBA8967602.1 hypothetical protein [Clostridium butyricum]MBA8971331.1 hypothetical protein [Clostridium butyricum]NOW36803.1 hypothetical protein [Clostridium butyricum]WBP97599.1 hypothetical protein O4N14_09975 [Clostridium butyricum]